MFVLAGSGGLVQPRTADARVNRAHHYRMSMQRLISTGAMLLVTCAPARADRVGYQGVVDLHAESELLTVTHHHDWSPATHDARWKMIATTQDPFSAENDYAWLAVRERASGAELFRRPVPPLNYLWISPDSNYVVGLSEVKSWNPVQVVVFRRDGQRLFEASLANQGVPGASESISTWIHWYHLPQPTLAIQEMGNRATLSVQGRTDIPIRFTFDLPP